MALKDKIRKEIETYTEDRNANAAARKAVRSGVTEKTASQFAVLFGGLGMSVTEAIESCLQSERIGAVEVTVHTFKDFGVGNL